MSNIQEQPVTFIIFGASGDLTHRKLLPSLFSLFVKKRLPDNFHIIGYAINDWDDTVFRKSLRDGVEKFAETPFSSTEWDRFAEHLSYMAGNFTNEADFQRLKANLQTIDHGTAGRIYYLATPPPFFPDIAQNLGHVGLLDEKEGWRRLVIEKPFGSSLETAKKLNRTLHQVLKEDQIFRIDHYLGKETVQNLLVFRFANTIFEPVWCNEYIDCVQISVAEEVGVGHRAGYYDKAGVLRDMFQNHILQLLTLITIDPPDTLKHEDLHSRKIEILKALRPITGEDVKKKTVRAQYKGYLQEPGIPSDSPTATFAVIEAHIDNDRWKGVPFFLRSGKELKKKATEIIIQFKCPPYAVFPMPRSEDITPNILAMCIQPDEGIFLRFEAKVPDTEADMRSVEMEFHYASSFGATSIPDAYERLVLEVIQGDHTLFTQDDSVELAWSWIDPIIKAWDGPDAPPLETYDTGSWGPDAANHLIDLSGSQWMITCGSQDAGG